MTALPRRRAFPAWIAPLALLLALVALFATVILLARRAAAPDVPPEPGAFERPSPVRPVVALDVQQADGGRLTLSDGSRDVPLDSGVRVEALRPATAEQIRPGDWLAVVGVPNEVRNFAIRSLVVLPSPGAPDHEGVVRSPGGFAGHEASRDQNERPVMGGVVTAVDGRRIVLQGAAGPITVELTPNAPLRRLSEMRADEVREGDRIAFSADSGRVTDARSLLVLPGGAR